jgi:transposase
MDSRALARCEQGAAPFASDIERTLAWTTRCRRTVRDYERLPADHETIVYWAMTITMTRRLAGRPAVQAGAA